MTNDAEKNPLSFYSYLNAGNSVTESGPTVYLTVELAVGTPNDVIDDADNGYSLRELMVNSAGQLPVNSAGQSVVGFLSRTDVDSTESGSIYAGPVYFGALGNIRQGVDNMLISGNGVGNTVIAAVSSARLIVSNVTLGLMDLTFGSGSTVMSIAVISGGELNLSAAELRNIEVLGSGGTQNVYGGGYVSGGRILGGTQNVHAGGKVFSHSNSGGEQNVYDGGSASAVTFISGGVQNVHSGGTVSNGYFYGNATGNIYNGGRVSLAVLSGAGSKQNIYEGGLAATTNLRSGAVQTIYSGGTGATTLISAGTKQYVSAGGYASTNWLYGGESYIYSGAVASNNFIASSGTVQIIYFGAYAEYNEFTNGTQIVYGSAYLTYISRGLQQVSSGGVAMSNTIYSSGRQDVYGGNAFDTRINAGTQNLYSGGLASLTVISARGIQNIYSGGLASDTIVSSNGRQYVLDGGVAHDAIISYGGIQYVSGGGIISGTHVVGGSMHLYQGAVTAEAEVVLDVSRRWYFDGVMINDLTLLDTGVDRILTSGGLMSAAYQLAGSASAFGSSLAIGFAGGGSAAVGEFAWLAAAGRYSGAAEDTMRYEIRYSGDNLVLSAHQRYELLDAAGAEAVADDISYTDLRGGSSAGYYARLTSGRSYADVFGGGSLNDVTGRITLSMDNRASAAMVVGGGNGRNVSGDILLTIRGTTTGVAGGGVNADVEGKISLDFDGTFTGRSFVAGGGFNGNIGLTGNTGTAIDLTVAISSYDVTNSFKIIGGNYATTVYNDSSFVYGDISLKLGYAGGVGSQLTELVCGGSFREEATGTSTVTGDVVIVADGFVQNNLMFGGGMARAAASGMVNSIVEGGVSMDLKNVQFTTSLVALGGYSNGQRTYTQVGTAANLAGGNITIRGSSTKMAAVAGGGYAIGGGRSVIYGDVTITMSGDGMTGPQIYGGGYCNGGVVINYGKTTITVDGNSPTSNVWGGGLVYSNSEVFLTQGSVIAVKCGYNSSITRIFGGGRSVNAGDTSVGYDEDYNEVASSVGTNISIDSTVTVGNIYGGGFQLGNGWTGVSGGTHITINGGTASNIFGGGYSEATGTTYGDEVNGGTCITVNGGNVQNVYGGGHGYSTQGKTVVNGGSHILFNSADTVVDIGGYVYGGGLYRSTVNGGSTIEFTGLGSKLIFSEADGGYVCGAGTSNAAGKVNGSKHLKFTGFTGNFDAWLDQFDIVTLAGSRVTWTAPQDYLKTASTWNFEVFEAETTLEWQLGSNNFNGDALNLNFDAGSLVEGTVIEGGNASIFTGWNNTSNTVSFNGTAGSWNSGLNAWVSADDTWKLYLDGTSLKLGLA